MGSGMYESQGRGLCRAVSAALQAQGLKMSSFLFIRTHERFKEDFGLPPHPPGQDSWSPIWGQRRQDSIIGPENTSAGFSVCAFLIGEMGVVSSPRDI